MRRLLKLCFALVVLGIAAVGILWLTTPSPDDAWDRLHTLTSEKGSTELGRPVPERFEAALLSTEASRFYQHHGIDSLGVLRGGFGLIRGQETGGSTVNQQLAKNLYWNGEHPLRLVPAQLTMALKLDFAYSKSEILQMYADIAYFGHGFHGLRDAACGYFGVEPDELSWSQASLLAGLVQAPSNYDPLTNPGLAEKRQQHVVNRLVATGSIDAEQAAQLTPASWELSPGAGC